MYFNERDQVWKMRQMKDQWLTTDGQESPSEYGTSEEDASERSEYDLLKDESHHQLLEKQSDYSSTNSSTSNDPNSTDDTITSLTRITKLRTILRSVSSESSTSTGRPLPITITHFEPKSQGKHAFTVCNYGSADISSIPASPESVFQQDGPQFTFDRPYRGYGSTRSSYFMPSNASSAPNSVYSTKLGTAQSTLCGAYTETLQSKKHVQLDFGNNNNESKDVILDISNSGENNVKETFSSLDKNKNYNFLDVIKRGRIFAKRRKDRLVQKSGEVNVDFIHVKKRSLKFFQDMFTTLLDAKWRYLVLVFVLAFLVTWIGFAFLWWAIAIYEISYAGNVNATQGENPCLIGVYNFPSAVLFSVETQHTIGYGTRAVTPECPLAIIFVMFQSLVGVILSCVTTGLIFAKFARPKRRAETILFSKKAVICERNGKRCLMFRIGDMRKSHMISVNIRAILVDGHTTKEGETIPFYQHNLHIQTEAEDFFFLAWPFRAIHYIDESSPLWDMSEEKLLESDFEIVVVFEGTNSSTGQTTQVRTSYLPSEILWGQMLETLLTKQLDSGQFIVDFTKFHETANATISGKSAKTEADEAKSTNNNDRIFLKSAAVSMA